MPKKFTVLDFLSSNDLIEKLYEASKNEFFTQFDINQKIFDEKPLLFSAIEFGFYKVVNALLEVKASSNLNYSYPVQQGQISLFPLHWAVVHGEIECFEVLLSNKPSSFQEDSEGIGNILHVAIQSGQRNMLEYLLDNHKGKISQLLERLNPNGQTPLILAASLGDNQSIALLYEKGANLKAKNSKDQTALHVAALENHHNTIRFLVYLGANSTVDSDNKKPVDFVEDEEVRLFLLKPKNRAPKSRIYEFQFPL